MHYSYLMQEPSEFVSPRQRDKKHFHSKYTFWKFSQPDQEWPSFEDSWNNDRLRLLGKVIFWRQRTLLFVNSEIFWIWWSEILIFRQRFVFSIVPAWAHFIRFGMNAIKVIRKSRPKRTKSQIRINQRINWVCYLYLAYTKVLHRLLILKFFGYLRLPQWTNKIRLLGKNLSERSSVLGFGSWLLVCKLGGLKE